MGEGNLAPASRMEKEWGGLHKEQTLKMDCRQMVLGLIHKIGVWVGFTQCWLSVAGSLVLRVVQNRHSC